MNEQAYIPIKEMEAIRQVYFIGIGGIGMSAVARFFQAKGVQVSGYDKTPTPLTREMEAAGIAVHYEEDTDRIPLEADLVVYTPAVPAAHRELVYYRENGYAVVKRSDVLQLVTRRSFNICVAGTHGKTTTSTMIAHLLRDSGAGGTAFLGGIAANYQTNFWSVAGNDANAPQNISVVEADEYDRSFLKLSPDIAVITSMDPDHLDIYGTAEAMEQAFIDFSSRIKQGGLLVSKQGLKRSADLQASRRLTYSLHDEKADAYAANIRVVNGSYLFDVVLKDNILKEVQLNMGGMHNIENAIAAITVASSLGISDDSIRKAVHSFRGVKRRFEYILPPAGGKGIVFIDDYAHHPEELRALIGGAKALFPDQPCTVVFQPHLYSRTRDLADGFAEVLDMADEAILLPIYPARELPVEGVTSAMIAEKKRNPTQLMEKEELVNWIKNEFSKKSDTGQVLITAGAGDIDTLVETIKQYLETV
ncbi:MAG: UDP-N-acetylmuramate--L-alanine ligase [Chitinophagaceae bacterium]